MGTNRRSFIKYASLAAAGNAAGLRPFGMLNSLAQTTTDYKALVCIFLFGGNDANNTLIQFDTAGYANYSSVRGPLAIPQSTSAAAGWIVVELRVEPESARCADLVQQQGGGAGHQCGDSAAADDACAVPGGDDGADESVLPHGPAAGVAERVAVGSDDDRVGGAELRTRFPEATTRARRSR